MGDDKKLKKTKVPSVNNMKVQKEIPRKFVEPDEWYIGEFEKCESKDGNYGPYCIFTFKMLNGTNEDGSPAKGAKVNRIMDAAIAPGREIYNWACVMMGKKELKEGDSVNWTSHYGKKFRIFVADKKKNPKNPDAKRYQEVRKIKRKKKPEPESK